MNFYRVLGLHHSGKMKPFRIMAEDITQAKLIFKNMYPDLAFVSIEFLHSGEEDKYASLSPSSPPYPSKSKRRGYFKTRLCQIRANLQSMTDSEEGLLTPEETIQLQRITCKVDRVIALFHERTMELKTKGELG